MRIVLFLCFVPLNFQSYAMENLALIDSGKKLINLFYPNAFPLMFVLQSGGNAISLCSELECPRILSSIDGVESMDENGWIFHGLRDAFAIFELADSNLTFQHEGSQKQASWIGSVKITSGYPSRDDLRISSFRLWSTEAIQPAFPPSWLGHGNELSHLSFPFTVPPVF